LSNNKTENISLFKIIKEDLKCHGTDLTRPGFRALAVCRFGKWRLKIKYKLLRAPFSLLYRILFRFVRNFYGIEIPCSVLIGRRVVIEHQHGIVIHGAAEIGNDCVIRQGVTIGNRYLHLPFEAPKIGNGVNIGAGAVILGNITIGNNSNIGANAVVLKDVPNEATAVGNPAIIIKKDR
jgi:serine O-acetyltransferase